MHFWSELRRKLILDTLMLWSRPKGVNEVTKKAGDIAWNLKQIRFNTFLSSVSKQTHTYQSMQIQRHIKPHRNPPPFFHKYTLIIHTKKFILSRSQELTIFWSVTVYARACMAVVHCNPHVDSPSCQGPICLYYHHTAGGSRSGKSDASLSRCKKKNKKQLHRLDICHVTSTQDNRH